MSAFATLAVEVRSYHQSSILIATVLETMYCVYTAQQWRCSRLSSQRG